MVGIIPAWVHQPVKPALPPHVGNQQHHEGSDRKAEHQKQESDRKFTHGSLHLQFDKDKANLLPEKKQNPQPWAFSATFRPFGTQIQRFTGFAAGRSNREYSEVPLPESEHSTAALEPQEDRPHAAALEPQEDRPHAAALEPHVDRPPAVSEPHGNRPGRLGPSAGRLRAV